ncbi:uncharacterized protein LOC125226748 isoform X2 [Leguminivora glycinivorella]|nr:uncharacterized protein LOC125226748 isoform X2 [Leguminivora glycinivorella]
MLMVVTETDDSYNKVAIFLKLDKDWDMSKNVSIPAMELGRGGIHSFFGCLCWRLAGNRAYVIDASGVLWECCAIDRDLTVTASAKYYGLFPRTANSPIHLTSGDVYVSINCGNLVTVTKDNMMFRKVKMTEIPTKVIENFKKTKTPCREGFNTFNAFIKFPLDTEFVDRSVAPLNMIHYHYVDPDMTCALQLGDVVFQGFVDGEIKITLLRNYFKLNLNVKQFDQDEVSDCAVTALDIYEMKGMHKLMVATKHKLYAILLKYTELRTSDWMES